MGLAGEGSFAINGLEVARFDPAAFATVGGLDNIVDLAPDQFAGIIGQALERGPVAAPVVSGSFTLASGSLRSANLAVETSNVRLHGSGTIRLADLSLDGTYTMTPKGTIGTSGLISEATSQVVAHVAAWP